MTNLINRNDKFGEVHNNCSKTQMKSTQYSHFICKVP